MSTAIVTDSTSDIPADLAEKLNITIVPNHLIIDGKSYTDLKDITREAFYERLPRMKTFPTTAAASAGSYQRVYEGLFQKGFKHILSIHASSLLSGIYNAASVAAQAFNGAVQVVDSRQVTMGLGFQVLLAAEAVASVTDRLGEAPQRVIEMLENARQRIRLIAMLDTLEYVRRSGRVSWARARLGEALRIKPFIEIKDGKVVSLGEARTYVKGIARLLDFLHKLGPLERLAVLHVNAAEEAQRFLDQAGEQIPAEPFVINVSTVIGAHAGPRGIGFAALVKAKPW